jgi:mannose-1-phosphate guanylyltransferase
MVPSYAVILAGGKGERFWPLSTPERPKPFLKLFGERSLLQATGERLLGIFPQESYLCGGAASPSESGG